jgi:predicted nucleic acid-binding protein
MAERFLLDTSAFVAFFQAEPGASRVLDLLERAARHEVEVFACFVSLTEVQYITFYDYGEEAARKAIADLKRLTLSWQHSDDALCASAADLKAMHKVSFADAFVVAAALRFEAVLVHKDPELAAIPSPLRQEMLPPRSAVAGTK